MHSLLAVQELPMVFLEPMQQISSPGQLNTVEALVPSGQLTKQSPPLDLQSKRPDSNAPVFPVKINNITIRTTKAITATMIIQKVLP